MNNYEYIIASLPLLKKDEGCPDLQSLVERIKRQCGKEDCRKIDFLLSGWEENSLTEDFYRSAAASSNAFIRGYFAYDLLVRNTKVEYLNRELGRPAGQDTIRFEQDGEFELAEKAEQALAAGDILSREKALDDLCWEQADELAGMQVFTLDAILAFVSKLKIVDRWLKLDPETGRELFARLVSDIRNNKNKIQ